MTMNAIHLRNCRVEQYLKLVRPIAISLSRRSGQDSDDLIQVGMLGLIKACDSFKPNHCVPFAAFARPHIRGAILHYLRDHSALVRLPRRIEERAQSICRHAHIQTSAEDEQIVMLYRSKSKWCCLDENTLLNDHNQWEELQKDEHATAVQKALKRLHVQERQAIQLVILEGNSLRKAAAMLNVSTMTVQRRVKRGLSQLSSLLNALQPVT